MNNIFFPSILIILFLMVTSGCSGWIGILDTNPYDDKPVDDKVYHEQRTAEIRDELLGLSKEEVLKKLGRPEWVNKLGNNYQAPAKFRENQYVFDGTKRCRILECGPIFEDESWAYSWERKTHQYYTQHGFGVFFKNGVVASVE